MVKRTMVDDHARISHARKLIHDWFVISSPNLYPITGEPTELAFRWKCLNELAFYTVFLTHLGFSDDSDLLAAEIDPLLDGVLADIALRSSQRSLIFTFVLARMLRHKLVDATRRQRIEASLSGPFCWGEELPAHRQLDLLAACEYGNIGQPLQHSLIISVSSVAMPPCPIVSSRDAFYALCHTMLFYDVLKQSVSKTDTLLEVLDGAACRAVASEDFDLGLEIVAATLSAHFPLTKAMREIVLETLSRLETIGLRQDNVSRFSAIAAFIDIKPAQREWAASFHLMLTAGLALAMVQERNATLETSDGPQEDCRLLGNAMLSLNQNAIAESLLPIQGYTPVTDLGHSHLRRIVRFVGSLRQENEAFGFLVEERALFSSLKLKGDFNETVERPLTERCNGFLKQFSVL